MVATKHMKKTIKKYKKELILVCVVLLYVQFGKKMLPPQVLTLVRSLVGRVVGTVVVLYVLSKDVSYGLAIGTVFVATLLSSNTSLFKEHAVFETPSSVDSANNDGVDVNEWKSKLEKKYSTEYIGLNDDLRRAHVAQDPVPPEQLLPRGGRRYLLDPGHPHDQLRPQRQRDSRRLLRKGRTDELPGLPQLRQLQQAQPRPKWRSAHLPQQSVRLHP